MIRSQNPRIIPIDVRFPADWGIAHKLATLDARPNEMPRQFQQFRLYSDNVYRSAKSSKNGNTTIIAAGDNSEEASRKLPQASDNKIIGQMLRKEKINESKSVHVQFTYKQTVQASITLNNTIIPYSNKISLEGTYKEEKKRTAIEIYENVLANWKKITIIKHCPERYYGRAQILNNKGLITYIVTFRYPQSVKKSRELQGGMRKDSILMRILKFCSF
ncbi:uncharacterized protein LOC143201053 [Rhynchophorus ferrugineus]|uniref:uncharacterized protein LOC143201053 n=1 Tax=Rhynchophorus ferrugineus TaxID=354439 RepID=UPI003FCCFF2C